VGVASRGGLVTMNGKVQTEEKRINHDNESSDENNRGGGDV